MPAHGSTPIAEASGSFMKAACTLFYLLQGIVLLIVEVIGLSFLVHLFCQP